MSEEEDSEKRVVIIYLKRFVLTKPTREEAKADLDKILKKYPRWTRWVEALCKAILR